MNSHELIFDFDRGPGDPRSNLLYARLLLSYLADHVYQGELANGAKVRDVTDFHLWLKELSEEARKIAKLPQGTEVSLRQELRRR